jgi:hypothetical protein
MMLKQVSYILTHDIMMMIGGSGGGVGGIENYSNSASICSVLSHKTLIFISSAVKNRSPQLLPLHIILIAYLKLTHLFFTFLQPGQCSWYSG